METHESRGKSAWRGLIAAAAIVAIIAGMRAAADLIVPFLLALSIAIICLPPLTWMQQRRVPTWIAVLLLIVLIIVVVLGFGAVIGNSVGNFVQDLPKYEHRGHAIMQQVVQSAHDMGISLSTSSLHETLGKINIFGYAATFLTAFGALLGESVLILLAVIFLLFEASVLPRKLAEVPRGGKRHRSMDVFSSFVDSVQRYVFVKTVISIGLGILVALVLWGLGLRYAILWGLLAFLLNYVPNFGAFISAIPAALLALLQGGWELFAYVSGALLIIHTITGNLIEPRLMGPRLGLSTMVVFFSLIIWGWVLGPVGMLLSIPLTMIIRIGFESYPETRWLAVLLGPAPESETQHRFQAWLHRLKPGSGKFGKS